MSETISSDLLIFKNKVGSNNISNMQKTLETIDEKMSKLKQAASSASVSFSSFYNSTNKSTIMSKFDNVSTIYDKISKFVTNDLSNVVSDSNKLLTKIDDLLEKKTLVDSSYNDMISNKDSEQYSSYLNRYNSLKSEFDNLQTEATELLNDLKSMDKELSFNDDFQVSSFKELSDYLEYGTFTKKVFKASDGKSMSYYLYVPDVEDTTGLPMMVYMHGSGERGSGVLNNGLPKQINDKTVVPQGMVVCVQLDSEGSFTGAAVQNRIAELTKSVADEYKVDKNRISASGHSLGAQGCYGIAANHPNLFSCVVPVSGDGLQAYQEKISNSGIKVWAFHGANDVSIEYSRGKNTVNGIKSSGGDAELYTFENDGHRIQNIVFNNEYEYKGEKVNPLDWAFNQVKNA